jgi:nicotinamide mononucleotide (NMN) deamidase PncC
VARELGQRGVRLAIREIGTGGAFSSLLSANAESAGAFEIDVVEPSSGNGESPVDVATRTALEPRSGSPASIGVSLAYNGTLNDRGVSEGTLAVAISDPNRPEPQVFQWQLRASLPEIQRRAALNAVEALRKHLKDPDAP